MQYSKQLQYVLNAPLLSLTKFSLLWTGESKDPETTFFVNKSGCGGVPATIENQILSIIQLYLRE